MYEPSWRQVGIIAYATCLIISILSLVILITHVSRRCSAIFLSGDDCGVGIGWFWLAGALVVMTGINSVMLYGAVREE